MIRVESYVNHHLKRELELQLGCSFFLSTVVTKRGSLIFISDDALIYSPIPHLTSILPGLCKRLISAYSSTIHYLATQRTDCLALLR